MEPQSLAFVVLAILVAVYVLPALLRGHDVRANMRGADRYSSRLRLLKTDEPRGTRIADAANARRPRLLPEGSRPVMSRSTITAKRRTEAKQALAEVLQHRQVRVRAVNTAASRYRLLLFTAVVTFGSLVYVVARTGVSAWTLLLPVAGAALVMWGNLKLRADWRAEDAQLRAEIAEHRQVAGIPPGVTVRVPHRSERETVVAANPGPGPREGAARAVPTPAAGTRIVAPPTPAAGVRAVAMPTPAAGVRAVGGKQAPAGGPRRPPVPAGTWRPLSEAAELTEAQGTPAAGDIAGEQRSVDQRAAEPRDSKRAAGSSARRWWRRAAADEQASIVRTPAAERSFSRQVPHVERPGSAANGTPVAGIAVGGPTPTPAVGLTVGTPVGGISIGTPAAGMALGTPVAGIPVGGAVPTPAAGLTAGGATPTPAAGLTVGTPVAGVPLGTPASGVRVAGAAATPAGGVAAVEGDDKSWTPRPVPPPLYTLQPVVHPRTASPYEEPTSVAQAPATPARGNQPLEISAHELAEVERALTGHSQLEEATRRSVEDILERRRDSA
ncbi:hypothetical protein EII12_02245 [Buchananella hordeovulneris]|uniref:hypothetical protein n=1 Tax=Buchananella hordeovulneris TaxID=52770 RepID=UPI000F5F176A|nr:hypothetical protein [Buchananella hordeovulneris]RRD53309.1 hypothetical protein EII12_02245 [Buchananella hordeovulneris]